MQRARQIEKVVQLESAADEELLRAIAAECGATTRTPAVRAPDPAAWLLIVGGSTLIVGTVVERWQDRRLGGQVIDLRPGAERMLRRDAGVVFGYVVVLLPDSKVDIHLREPEHQLAALVTRIIDVAGDDQPVAELLAERVAEIAQEVAGGDASISIEPAAVDDSDTEGAP